MADNKEGFTFIDNTKYQGAGGLENLPGPILASGKKNTAVPNDPPNAAYSDGTSPSLVRDFGSK